MPSRSVRATWRTAASAASVDGAGMAVGVAAPDADRGHAGTDAVEESGQARVGAAVVGDLQHLRRAAGRARRSRCSRRRRSGAGRSRPTRAWVTTARSLGLPSGRQPGRGAGGHRNLSPSAPSRIDCTGLDGPHGATAAARQRRAEPALHRGRPAGAAVEHEPGPVRADHGERHPLVVGLRVGEHEHVEPVHARLGEALEDRAARRPGVEQHAHAALLEQHRVALADVEERDDELTGPRARARGRAGTAMIATTAAAASAAATASRRRGAGARARRRSRRAARCATIPAAPRAAYAAARPIGPPMRTGTAASGSAEAVLRHPADVAQQRPGGEHRRAGRAPARPARAATASMPSHITGATAGAASRLAGSDASETCSKCSASSGAVATVAASVIAAASATGAGMRRAEPRPQRRDEREQADHRDEGELPARVAGGARVEREGDGGGEAERVPARRGPSRERGDQPGDAHHARALDRRPAARERHVQRDEHHRGDQAEPQRCAAERRQPRARGGSGAGHSDRSRRADERARSGGSPRARARRSPRPGRAPCRAGAPPAPPPARVRGRPRRARGRRRAGRPGRRVPVRSPSSGRRRARRMRRGAADSRRCGRAA